MKGKVISYKLWVISLVIFLSFPQVGCYAQQAGNIALKDNLKKSDPYSWDFGQVREGEVLRHSFVLKNEFQGVLNIKDVNTSCGCTVSKVEKKTLLPGESTLIEVEFNTKGYSGFTQQFVYVHTDNLDNPVIRYIIKANIAK